MKTRYFIVSPDAVRDGIAVIDGPEFHHSIRVSRVRAGEAVRLIDGRGGLYEALVERIEGSRAVMRITSYELAPERMPVDIALGAVKVPRLEIAVEKCTELGARAIIPFCSERCIRRGGEDAAARGIERLRRKALASCKQAGRPHFPSLERIESFEELAERVPSYERTFLADPRGTRIVDLAGVRGAVLGIVGPEGGLTDGERDLLVRRGAELVSLSDARLRAETAAISLLYRLRCEYAGRSGAV